MIQRLETFVRPAQYLARRRVFPIVVVAVSLVWTSGCGRNAPPEGVEGSLPPTSQETRVAHRMSLSAADRSTAARQELRRAIARYRAAASYRDRAVVRMTYRVGETVEQDSAPLSVHYIAPDELAMNAYSARLEWRGGTLRAFVNAPEVNRLDRQLLQRTFKNPRIEVGKLYQDPVVGHFAAAGPGGPAPQIELLFGEEPLAGFFAEGTRLDLGEDDVIDGHRCRHLMLETEGSTYALWIDHDEALIRRIELPSIALPQMQGGYSETGEQEQPALTAEVDLSIDFVDAEIDGPSESVAGRLPHSGVVTVDTLTLPPPSIASPLLGRQAEPFRLQCRTHGSNGGTFAVTDRGSDREYTILLWVANHSGSGFAIEHLAMFADQLPSELRRKIRFVVLQAEKLEGSAGRELMQQSSLAWAMDEEAVGRDRFAIDQAPALCVVGARGNIHWLQSPVGPELATTLDGLLRDLRAGIDVGPMLREQHAADVATYRQLLEDRAVE